MLHGHQLGPLHKRSAFRHMDALFAEVYGTLFKANGDKYPRSSPKPRVHKSPYYELIEDHYGEPKYALPDFKKRTYVDGESSWADPMFANVQRALEPSLAVSQTALGYSVDAYLDGVDVEAVKEHAMPLDMAASINGLDGYKFMNTLNKTTSAGFPNSGSKMQFLEPVLDENGALTDKVQLIESMQKEFDLMDAKVRSGRSLGPVFNASLKTEEVVTPKKVEAGKYRVFLAGPMLFTILVRKYYLTMVRLFCLDPAFYESYVGTDFCSPQWGELHSRITQKDHCFDGDFSAFDRAVPRDFLDAAFRVLLRLAHVSGNYSEKDLVACRVIAGDIIHFYCNMNGDLVRFEKGNASGHPLTTLINGITNSLLMRYGYYCTFGRVHDFRANVALATFGDDQIVGVDDVAKDFNLITLQAEFKSIGVNYTPADKLAEAQPFCPPDKLQFLKRSFVKRGEDVWGPLEYDSILKSLYFTKETSLSPLDHTKEIIENTLNEMAIHGEEHFFRLRNLIVDNLSTFHESLQLSDVPEYENVLNGLTQRVKGHVFLPLDETYLTGDTPFMASSGVVDSSSHAAKSGDDAPSQMADGDTAETSQQYENTYDDHMLVNTGDVVKFLDQQPATGVGVMGVQDSSADQGIFMDVSLDQFLSRPVRIAKVDWALGSGLTTDFYPWLLYLNNTAVAAKLQNYAFLSANLHVKLLVNASKFHYAAAYVSYLPFVVNTPNHYPSLAVSTRGSLMKASQLMRTTLKIGHGNTYTMCIPYHSQYDKETRTATEDYGVIQIRSICDLQAASSAPATDITITVYAWLTNVKLQGTTYSASSGVVDAPPDEYGLNNIISKPAGIIARAANVLSEVPVLNKPMSVVAGAARTIESVAKFFGLSKPAVMHDTMYMKPKMFSDMAVVQGAETAAPLSFDPKAAVAMDPAIASLETIDELTMQNMAGKMSYINQYQWDTTQSEGTVLGSIYVTPMLGESQAVTNGTQYVLPSISYAVLPFQFWSGSIKYKFTFVASSYHTGRIIITYDPVSATSYDTSLSSLRQTWIIDVSETTETTLIVPWNKGVAYREIGRNLSGSDFYSNGQLQIVVDNELSTPSAASYVTIFVEMCAGSDFEVFQPKVIAPTDLTFINPYRLQLGLPVASSATVSNENQYSEVYMFGRAKSSGEISQRRSVYVGEVQYTLREYMKRYGYVFTHTISTSGAVYHRYTLEFTDFPAYIGPPPSAAAARSSTGATTAFNYGNNSIMQYYAMSFLGYRGSIRYKMVPNVNSSGRQGTFTITRGTPAVSVKTSSISVLALNNVSVSDSYTMDVASRAVGGFEGTQLYFGEVNPCFEFTIPYYDNKRYRLLDFERIIDPDFNYRNTLNMTVASRGTADYQQASVDVWVSPGEDFNFIWYLGCPILYQQTTWPAPPA
jgi:hypothetical protein